VHALQAQIVSPSSENANSAFVKHHVPALWKTAKLGHQLISRSPYTGAVRYVVETSELRREIAFGLGNTPLLERVFPNRFEVLADKGA